MSNWWDLLEDFRKRKYLLHLGGIIWLLSRSRFCCFAYFQIFWHSLLQQRRDLCLFSLNLGRTSWYQMDTMLSDAMKQTRFEEALKLLCTSLGTHTFKTWGHCTVQKPKPQTCEWRQLLWISAPDFEQPQPSSLPHWDPRCYGAETRHLSCALHVFLVHRICDHHKIIWGIAIVMRTLTLLYKSVRSWFYCI